jgi:hypothetical protein
MARQAGPRDPRIEALGREQEIENLKRERQQMQDMQRKALQAQMWSPPQPGRAPEPGRVQMGRPAPDVDEDEVEDTRTSGQKTADARRQSIANMYADEAKRAGQRR